MANKKQIKHYYKGEMVDITKHIHPNSPTKECSHKKGSYCSICNLHLFNETAEISGAVASYLMSKKLQKAKQDYYGKGNSDMTDAEYDAMESSLRAINPEAEILQKVGMEFINGENGTKAKESARKTTKRRKKGTES